jgi:transposase
MPSRSLAGSAFALISILSFRFHDPALSADLSSDLFHDGFESSTTAAWSATEAPVYVQFVSPRPRNRRSGPSRWRSKRIIRLYSTSFFGHAAKGSTRISCPWRSSPWPIWACRRNSSKRSMSKVAPEKKPRRKRAEGLVARRCRKNCRVSAGNTPSPNRSCGTELSKIRGEASEQLEYIPRASRSSSTCVEYARTCCEETIQRAPKPPQAIEKGLPGPGLLAHVALSKYGDHLPLSPAGHLRVQQPRDFPIHTTLLDCRKRRAGGAARRLDAARIASPKTYGYWSPCPHQAALSDRRGRAGARRGRSAGHAPRPRHVRAPEESAGGRNAHLRHESVDGACSEMEVGATIPRIYASTRIAQPVNQPAMYRDHSYARAVLHLTFQDLTTGFTGAKI